MGQGVNEEVGVRVWGWVGAWGGGGGGDSPSP